MKNWAEADTAQIYQQPYFDKIKRATNVDVTRSVRDLVQQGTAGPLLESFSRKLSPDELAGSLLDPNGRAAPIFRPRELSNFLAALMVRSEVIALWVGQNAYLTAQGEFKAQDDQAVGDLDLSFMSLNEQKPLISAGYFYNRLRDYGFDFRIAPDFPNAYGIATNPVVGEFRMSPDEKESRLRLAFLRSKRYPTYQITAAKIYHKTHDNRPDWIDIHYCTVADVGYSYEDSTQNFLKSSAFLLPREDSLCLLLVPKPKKDIPFDVWLIDPQQALKKDIQTETISYPPESQLLYPQWREGCRGISKAQEAIVRGLRLSYRRHKKIPEGLFNDAAKSVHDAAAKRLPHTNEEKLKTSLRLEHLNEKLSTIVTEYPQLFGEFLIGEIAAKIFPRVAETLGLAANNQETIRDWVARTGHPFDKKNLTLADVIIFITAQAERHNLLVWQENKKRSRNAITESPRARNTFSAFPIAYGDLRLDPWGADVASTTIHRFVDVPLEKALKRIANPKGQLSVAGQNDK